MCDRHVTGRDPHLGTGALQQVLAEPAGLAEQHVVGEPGATGGRAPEHGVLKMVAGGINPFCVDYWIQT